MSQSETSAVSFLFDTVDKFGMNMVATTYHNIVSAFAPVFFTFATIYLGFIFIKMKRGHHDFNDLFMIVLRMVAILTLALNYQYFCLFIYDVFTKEPLVICKAIVSTGTTVHVTSISSALDSFLNAGNAQAGKLFMMGGWSNPTYVIFGILVFLITLITVAMAAGLIVLSKCAATILLALSPLFIFCGLYDSTKGLFDAYIKQLIAYALIPIFTSAILMILLSVSDVIIKSMNQHNSPTFLMLLPFGLMCIVQIYLMLQVKGKCAALAGGFTLPTVTSALGQFKNDVGSGIGHLKNMSNATKGIGSRTESSSFVGIPRKSGVNRSIKN